MDSSERCKKCPKLFSCFSSKEFWTKDGETPTIVFAEGKIDIDVEHTCHDKLEERENEDAESPALGERKRQLGHDFAYFLFCHADNEWLAGFLSQFNRSKEEFNGSMLKDEV